MKNHITITEKNYTTITNAAMHALADEWFDGNTEAAQEWAGDRLYAYTEELLNCLNVSVEEEE